MNIAFLSFDGNVGEGGVQTVSYILATEFRKYGVKSFLICDAIRSKNCPECYEDRVLYRNSEDNEILDKFLLENSIRIVINNCVVRSVYYGSEIRVILKKNNCKLVSIIHAKPDLIKVTPSVRSLLWNIRTSSGFLIKLNLIIRLLAFPLYKVISNKKYISWRKLLYDNSDKVVVLSEKYINNLCAMINVSERSKKILAIANPLRFNINLTEDEIKGKQNEILVVSRLDESSKGLSKVFKIWRDIEKTNKYNNWYLTVVGSGKDGDYYKHLCTKYKLANVSFEGFQNPLLYYKRAKIFLMTSFHEGLPMSVLEAQQCGMPVVAFNNFESIVDLVVDGYNGFVVKANDVTGFVQSLENIMDDESLYFSMSKHSVLNSRRFSSSVVVKHWMELFNELCGDE